MIIFVGIKELKKYELDEFKIRISRNKQISTDLLIREICTFVKFVLNLLNSYFKWKK